MRKTLGVIIYLRESFLFLAEAVTLVMHKHSVLGCVTLDRVETVQLRFAFLGHYQVGSGVPWVGASSDLPDELAQLELRAAGGRVPFVIA